MPGIHLKDDLLVHSRIRMMICRCITKRVHMCSGCICHMLMVVDILPPTEMQMAKHRCDLPSVCDLLYAWDIPIA